MHKNVRKTKKHIHEDFTVDTFTWALGGAEGRNPGVAELENVADDTGASLFPLGLLIPSQRGYHVHFRMLRIVCGPCSLDSSGTITATPAVTARNKMKSPEMPTRVKRCTLEINSVLVFLIKIFSKCERHFCYKLQMSGGRIKAV